MFLSLHNPDLLVVSETWLNETVPSAVLVPRTAYSVLRCDRTSGRGGGVALFVHSNLSILRTEELPLSFGCEILCADLLYNALLSFRLIVVYRPPACGHECTLEYLKNVSLLCCCDKPCIIVGDFNFDPTDATFASFLDFNSLLNCMTDVPTRGSRTIDFILSNTESLISNVSSLPNFSTSDHNTIGFCVTSLNLQKPAVRLSEHHDFSRCDFEKANAMILNTDWEYLFRNCRNIDELYSVFESRICFVINSCAPLRPSCSGPIRLPDYLQRLQAKKHFLWQDVKNNSTVDNRYKFEKCSLDYKRACTKYYANRERRITNSNNRRAFYSYVSSRLKNSENVEVIQSDNGDLIVDTKTQCEEFARYFSSVYITDNGHLPEFVSRCDHNVSDLRITYDIVYNAIIRLSSKNSLTPEGIPSIFLKRTSFSISHPLATIFNHSLYTGSLPSEWRTAFVVPLVKKHPKTRVSNYRPISLTSSVCKILETIVQEKILSHLQTNLLLSPEQYGFLPGKSTVSQLLTCFSQWFENYNSDLQTDVIYVDYAKAFDKVSHQKLLHKLRSYGISGCLLSWLKGFLQERTFRVKISEELSPPYTISSGVPQGSVLGPLLFLCYVNDLPQSLNSECKLFADDLKIHRALRDPAVDFLQLQDDLDSLSRWSDLWQLEISAEKCSVFHLNFKHECWFYLNDVMLPFSKTVRDLGVTITGDFGWSEHCRILIRKASIVSNSILRSFLYPDLKNYRLAFITYCRPILEYCSVIWSPQTVGDIKSVEHVQRNFTKIAFRKCFPGPVEPSYQQRLDIFNLENLELRRLYIDLIWCYKIVNGLCDIAFESMFSFAARASLSRVHPFQLQRNVSYKTKVQNSFVFRVIRIWNILPENVVRSTSVDLFKRKLRDVDFSSFVHV